MKKLAFISTVAIALVAALSFSACTPAVGGDTNTPDTGVSGTITSGHWTTDTYVSGDVTVTGSLIIDPGVTVTLASDTDISISAGAAFSAVGTAVSPIIFKSASSSIVWNQIYISDGAGTSLAPITMKFCTITGAGYGTYYAIQLGANYYTTVADIENCTIYGNAAGGIDALHAGPKTVIKANNFYSNTDFGLYVNDNVAFDNTNTFAASGTTVDLSNLKNAVAFYGNIGSARTFDITQVPYYLASDVSVLNGGSLTINPSVTVLFDQNEFLSVDTGAIFNANGSSSLTPITFKAKSASVTWSQIYFNDGAIANTMKYCTVTGAGYNSYYAIQVGANYNTAVVDIEYCLIAGNVYGGIEATNAGLGTKIWNNTFVSGSLTNNSTSVGPYDIETNGNSNVDKSTGNLPIGIWVN